MRLHWTKNPRHMRALKHSPRRRKLISLRYVRRAWVLRRSSRSNSPKQTSKEGIRERFGQVEQTDSYSGWNFHKKLITLNRRIKSQNSGEQNKRNICCNQVRIFMPKRQKGRIIILSRKTIRFINPNSITSHNYAPKQGKSPQHVKYKV